MGSLADPFISYGFAERKRLREGRERERLCVEERLPESVSGDGMISREGGEISWRLKRA